MRRLRVLVAAVWISSGAIVSLHGQDAAAHKAWMDDAGDLQDELREQLAARSGEKAAAAAIGLEDILAKTQAYWTGKHADDIVKIAQESRALATSVATAAKAGQIDQATAASATLSARCNACHDLHPEKR